MRKLFLLFLISLGHFLFSQTTSLIINNYSPYQLNTRFGASGLAGNCHPTLGSNPYTGNLNLTIPAASSTTNPFVVAYPTYASVITSSVPFDYWFVRTLPNANGQNRLWSNFSLATGGAIALNTNWSYFSFLTHTGNNSTVDDLYLEIGTCGTTPIFYDSGTNSDAEWFNISSGGITYTYVQIY